MFMQLSVKFGVYNHIYWILSFLQFVFCLFGFYGHKTLRQFRNTCNYPKEWVLLYPYMYILEEENNIARSV